MITSSLFVSSDLWTACSYFVPLLLLSWNLCGDCCVMPLYFLLRWLSQACFADTRGIRIGRLHGSSACHWAQTESLHQESNLFHIFLIRKQHVFIGPFEQWIGDWYAGFQFGRQVLVVNFSRRCYLPSSALTGKYSSFGAFVVIVWYVCHYHNTTGYRSYDDWI